MYRSMKLQLKYENNGVFYNVKNGFFRPKRARVLQRGDGINLKPSFGCCSAEAVRH